MHIRYFVWVSSHSPALLRTSLQVPGAGGPPHFRLHIQPGKPAQPGNKYGVLVSRAGEGKGLQVLPGSVTEVTAEVGCCHEHTV
jgi:hypothetical protein